MQDQKKNTENKKSDIIYDGACPMCSAVINKIQTSPQNKNFAFIDSTKNNLPLRLTRKEVEKEIHVVDSNGVIYKNAEAILKIFEKYPNFKLLVKIGKLPIIKQILPFVYKLIAANRYFIFGYTSRIFWLKITLSTAFISGLLLSSKLWMSSRFYPLTPVFKSLPIIPFPLDHIVFISLLILLGIIIISPKPKKYILAFIFLIGILALQDQSRWQPWAYQYIFMFIALSFYSWKISDEKTRIKILNTGRFIVASTYFWSGIQKINISFLNTGFTIPGPIYLSLIVPAIEIGIGIGLLTKKFRKIAIISAIILHTLILLLLGPLGFNTNSVIWPWNIAMIAFVLILFWKIKNSPSLKEVVMTKKFAVYKLIFILFGIMPLLSFFNIWDSYLSASLYSRNVKSAEIYINNYTKTKIPYEIQPYINKLDDVKGYNNSIKIFNWSMNELNVPPYPEERIFKNIQNYICKYTLNTDDITLIIHQKPNIVTGVRKSIPYDCPRDIN